MKYLISALFILLSSYILSSCTKEKQIIVACISMPSDTILVNDAINFTSCSVDAEEHMWFYARNSEIIASSSLENPSYIFNEKGVYDITLKIYSAPDGKDSTSSKLVVRELETEE